MRTTNALGTSWTSQNGSPQARNVAVTACGVASNASRAAAASPSRRVSGGAISTSWLSTSPVALAAAANIWLAASATADSSSSLGSPSPSSSPDATCASPIAAAIARAARSVISSTLPPVTPST